MMRLKWMKRFLSVVLCGAILTAGLYSGAGMTSVPVSAMTLAELQSEKQANADKIAQKQKELESLGSDQQEQADFQKALEDEDSTYTRKVWIYQPAIGAGFKLQNVTIDYAFTNLANQTNPLFTHVFSLRLNLVGNKNDNK